MSSGRTETRIFCATFDWDTSAPSVIYGAHSWEEALTLALEAQGKYGRLVKLEVRL